jgi:GTPase SAR1 family protein
MSQADANYSQFLARRKLLYGLLERSHHEMATLDMNEWTSALMKLMKRIRSDRFKVLVIGEFKRGKSTFINSLLGKEVLPAFATPCTAVINEIKWGREKSAILHFRNPLPEPLPPLPPAASEHIQRGGNGVPAMQVAIEDLEDYVCIPDPGKDQSESVAESPYDHVELNWPLELCRNGVEIIDSPGLNEHGTRQRITLDYLSTVDAVIFVMSCHALASQSEMRVIERDVIGAGHEYIFFVCNRYDQIRPRERERLVGFAKKRLADKTSHGESGIYFISALDALEGRLDGDEEMVQSSGVPRLEADLALFLTSDRGKIKLLTPGRELGYALDEALHKTIPGQERMLHQDLKKLEENYRAKQPLLQDAEKRRSLIMQRVQNDKARLLDEVKALAVNKTGQMADSIPSWIEGFEPENTITFFSLEGLKNQVKALVQEVAGHLSRKIEDEQAAWLQQEFSPLLERRINDMTDAVNDRVDDLLYRIDNIRADLAGVRPEELEHLHGKDIGGLERVLAAAGGFVIGGAGAALVGGAMGYQEMAKSLIPQILLVVTMIMVGFTNPITIIPALLVAGIAQGIWKAKGTTSQVVTKVAQEMASKLKENAYANAETTAKSVDEQVEKLAQSIEAGLQGEIQAVRDQVEAVLRDKRKGEASVQERITHLDNSRKNLTALNSKLSDLVFELAQMKG